MVKNEYTSQVKKLLDRIKDKYVSNIKDGYYYSKKDVERQTYIRHCLSKVYHDTEGRLCLRTAEFFQVKNYAMVPLGSPGLGRIAKSTPTFNNLLFLTVDRLTSSIDLIRIDPFTDDGFFMNHLKACLDDMTLNFYGQHSFQEYPDDINRTKTAIERVFQHIKKK